MNVKRIIVAILLRKELLIPDAGTLAIRYALKPECRNLPGV